MFQIAVGLITALGSVNAFFISRLVRKIDDSTVAVSEFKKDLQHMSEKLSSLSDLSGRIIELEKKIVLLEYKTLHVKEGS